MTNVLYTGKFVFSTATELWGCPFHIFCHDTVLLYSTLRAILLDRLFVQTWCGNYRMHGREIPHVVYTQCIHACADKQAIDHSLYSCCWRMVA